MKNLKVLNLSSNKLQEIQAGIFNQLNCLKSLDLSSNNLKTLETNAFTGLEKLQNLNLADNRLKVISSNILDSLKVLQIVDMTKNDCINLRSPEVTLKDIRDQLKEYCVYAVGLKCSTLLSSWDDIDKKGDYKFDECTAINLTIVHPKTKIAKPKNKNDYDSPIFSVIDQHIAFLPSNFGKVFINLHILVVDRSKLTALNQGDFEGLTNLTKITIVNNNISLIEPCVFDDVPQLEHLTLSSNNILTLPEMIFVKLVQLKTLNLSDNHLQSFFSELLPLNNVIKELRIKGNKIRETNLFNSMNFKKVKIIDLTNNICINIKYEKDKTDGNTFSELLQALRACSVLIKIFVLQ